MEEYKQPYLTLFNRVTDAIELLKSIQQEAEEAFLTESTEET